MMLANDSALVELALRILSPETLHRISREARVRARETAKRGRCTSPGPAPSEELAEDPAREDWVDSEGAAAACPSTARKRGRRTSSLQPEVLTPVPAPACSPSPPKIILATPRVNHQLQPRKVVILSPDVLQPPAQPLVQPTAVGVRRKSRWAKQLPPWGIKRRSKLTSRHRRRTAPASAAEGHAEDTAGGDEHEGVVVVVDSDDGNGGDGDGDGGGGSGGCEAVNSHADVLVLAEGGDATAADAGEEVEVVHEEQVVEEVEEVESAVGYQGTGGLLGASHWFPTMVGAYGPSTPLFGFTSSFLFDAPVTPGTRSGGGGPALGALALPVIPTLGEPLACTLPRFLEALTQCRRDPVGLATGLRRLSGYLALLPPAVATASTCLMNASRCWRLACDSIRLHVGNPGVVEEACTLLLHLSGVPWGFMCLGAAGAAPAPAPEAASEVVAAVAGMLPCLCAVLRQHNRHAALASCLLRLMCVAVGPWTSRCPDPRPGLHTLRPEAITCALGRHPETKEVVLPGLALLTAHHARLAMIESGAGAGSGSGSGSGAGSGSAGGGKDVLELLATILQRNVQQVAVVGSALTALSAVVASCPSPSSRAPGLVVSVGDVVSAHTRDPALMQAALRALQALAAHPSAHPALTTHRCDAALRAILAAHIHCPVLVQCVLGVYAQAWTTPDAKTRLGPLVPHANSVLGLHGRSGPVVATALGLLRAVMGRPVACAAPATREALLQAVPLAASAVERHGGHAGVVEHGLAFLCLWGMAQPPPARTCLLASARLVLGAVRQHVAVVPIVEFGLHLVSCLVEDAELVPLVLGMGVQEVLEGVGAHYPPHAAAHCPGVHLVARALGRRLGHAAVAAVQDGQA